jgi:hypothetical protein
MSGVITHATRSFLLGFETILSNSVVPFTEVKRNDQISLNSSLPPTFCKSRIKSLPSLCSSGFYSHQQKLAQKEYKLFQKLNDMLNDLRRDVHFYGNSFIKNSQKLKQNSRLEVE